MVHAADHTGLDSKAALRLWLRLYRSVAVIEQELRSRFLKEFGVSLSRFDVMSSLDHAEAPLTMGQLSDRLLVSNGNVSGLIARLVDDGLVVREASPDDRRVFTVELTPEGRQQFRRMADAHELWLAQILGALPGPTADLLSQNMDLLARHARLQAESE